MQQAAPELKRTFLDFVDQKGYFGQIKAMLSRKPPDQRLVLSLDDLREFDSGAGGDVREAPGRVPAGV